MSAKVRRASLVAIVTAVLVGIGLVPATAGSVSGYRSCSTYKNAIGRLRTAWPSPWKRRVQAASLLAELESAEPFYESAQ